MEMAILSNCRKEPEDEQQRSRKGKRKTVDLFEFLPDDILLDILKRLPDVYLGYSAKYVCRRWMDLISNKILLDHASFILQKRGNLTAQHVGIREEEKGLQAKVQDLYIPRIGLIRSCANEFLLIESDDNGKRSLYVYNLMTKKGSYLPECKASSCGGYCTIRCGVAVSFDVFKETYKVVHLFMGPPIECYILILRKDIKVSSEWKKIQVPCMNGWRFLSGLPVSVQGRYVHWDSYGDDKRLVSMDMMKELIVDISLPLEGDRMDYTIFEMGGSLALFARVSEDEVEIWILKDFQRKKWVKLQSVTLEKWYHTSIPMCGVMNNKYIIMEYCKFYEGMWYYDLKNGGMKKLDINIDANDCCVVHK